MRPWPLAQLVKRKVGIEILDIDELGDLNVQEKNREKIYDCEGDGHGDAVCGGGYVCSYFVLCVCALCVVLCCIVYV